MFPHVVFSDMEDYTKVKPIVSPNPVVIEGAQVYDTLCPVSKLTGVRENPLSLLSRVLDSAKARQLDLVLREIPSLSEGNQLSDDEFIDMCIPRLSSGSDAEDGVLRRQLESIIDVIRPSVPVSSEEQIEFKPSDVPQAE